MCCGVRYCLAIPMIAILSDSVPPDVKIIPSGSALIKLATCKRERSIVMVERSPHQCRLEGLPHCDRITATIKSMTSGRVGVVAP